MVEARFLIPKVQNANRRVHSAHVWEEFSEKFQVALPDARLLRRTKLVPGAYRSERGDWPSDLSHSFVTFVEVPQLDDFAGLLLWAHGAFGQEDGIYARIAGSMVIVNPKNDLPTSINVGVLMANEQQCPECCFFYPVTDAYGKPSGRLVEQLMWQRFRGLKLVQGYQGPEEIPLFGHPLSMTHEELTREMGEEFQFHPPDLLRRWVEVRVAILTSQVELLRCFLKRCHNTLGQEVPIVLSVAGAVETIQGGFGDGTLFDEDDED